MIRITQVLQFRQSTTRFSRKTLERFGDWPKVKEKFPQWDRGVIGKVGSVKDVAKAPEVGVDSTVSHKLAQAIWDHCKVEGHFARFQEDWAKVVTKYPYWEDEFMASSDSYSRICDAVQAAGVEKGVAIDITEQLRFKLKFRDHLSWPQTHKAEFPPEDTEFPTVPSCIPCTASMCV